MLKYSLNKYDHYYPQIILDAVDTHNLEIVKAIVENPKFDKKHFDEMDEFDETTPLWNSFKNRDFDIAEYLIDQGAFLVPIWKVQSIEYEVVDLCIPLFTPLKI